MFSKEKRHNKATTALSDKAQDKANTIKANQDNPKSGSKSECFKYEHQNTGESNDFRNS